MPSAICSSERYLSLQYNGQNMFNSIHEDQGKKRMHCSTQSWTASASAPKQATESKRAVLNKRCFGASGSALQQPKHFPVEETACMELWPSAAASHHFLGAVHGVPTTSSPSFGTRWQSDSYAKKLTVNHCILSSQCLNNQLKSITVHFFKSILRNWLQEKTCDLIAVSLLLLIPTRCSTLYSV